MSLYDNYFNCSESPVWIPSLFDINVVQTCSSCILRLTSQNAGTGNMSVSPNFLGFTESPLSTLAVNGVQHNLINSFMVFPGAHRLPGRNEVCAAEVFYYFQNTKVAGKVICLAVPLDIGKGSSNSYFSTLTTEVRGDRPPVSVLLTKKSTFLSFEAVTYQPRNSIDSRPKNVCDPPFAILTYYVTLQPAKILDDDLARLKSFYGKKPGPPKPTGPAMGPRLLKLCTVIKGITLDTMQSGSSGSSKNGVNTNAMKCYRLDKENDIIDDKVYIDGKNKPGTILSDELRNAALGVDTTDDGDDSESPIKPGDVENVIAIVIGSILALVICASVAVFLYRTVFRSYIQNQKLYPTVPSIPSMAIQPPLPGFFSEK